MGWNTCAGSKVGYLNVHTNDPVNTCAQDSLWECPTELGAEGALPLHQTAARRRRR